MVTQQRLGPGLLGSADTLAHAQPYLGIDVGGTHTKWAVVTDGVVQRAGQVATPRTAAPRTSSTPSAGCAVTTRPRWPVPVWRCPGW